MLGLMTEKPLLLIDILAHAARAHRHSTVTSWVKGEPARAYGYGEAIKRAARLGGALRARGLDNGGMIGTLAWSNFRHFEIYYGTAGVGAICHTINPRLSPDQIADLIAHAGDRLLFVEPDLLHLISGLIGTPGFPDVVVLCDEIDAPPGWNSYEGFLGIGHAITQWPSFDERTASSLCYTSGTTGKPKGILYSHRSSVLHAMSVCRTDTWAISGDDIVCSFAPMFHVNAWGLPYAAPLCGADLVLPGPHLSPSDIHRVLREQEVTLAFAVPTVWHDLLTFMDETSLRLPTLRRIVVSGSPLPREMLIRFEKTYGVEVLQAWGMTESSPMGMVARLSRRQKKLPPDEQTELRLHQGRPVFGVEAAVLDLDSGAPLSGLPAMGECAIRGYWVASSYYMGDAGSASAFMDDGWFKTGDVTTVNEDWFFRIVDRRKDAIKSGGEWISSLELEDAARMDHQIVDVAAIGLPHERWGERPVLAVVTRDADTFDLETLREHLRGRLQKWALPDHVLTFPSLPRSDTGKLLKGEIRTAVEARLASLVNSPGSPLD